MLENPAAEAEAGTRGLPGKALDSNASAPIPGPYPTAFPRLASVTFEGPLEDGEQDEDEDEDDEPAVPGIA